MINTIHSLNVWWRIYLILNWWRILGTFTYQRKILLCLVQVLLSVFLLLRMIICFKRSKWYLSEIAVLLSLSLYILYYWLDTFWGGSMDELFFRLLLGLIVIILILFLRQLVYMTKNWYVISLLLSVNRLWLAPLYSWILLNDFMHNARLTLSTVLHMRMLILNGYRIVNWTLSLV